tara:strand:- start:126 stop:335 length:210 start_codon:yes stop_codon:yes gene_type:complete
MYIKQDPIKFDKEYRTERTITGQFRRTLVCTHCGEDLDISNNRKLDDDKRNYGGFAHVGCQFEYEMGLA